MLLTEEMLEVLRSPGSLTGTFELRPELAEDPDKAFTVVSLPLGVPTPASIKRDVSNNATS